MPTAAAAEAPSLLALQAMAGAAAKQPDAAAALAHADVMLESLAALQHGLLAEAAPDRAALQRLADPAGPRPEDPALAEILDAVALRVAVELTRRGWPLGRDGD